MAPDRVCIIIAACCILHNIAVTLREPDPEDCDMEDDGCTAELLTYTANTMAVKLVTLSDST